ncbi:MAG: hypothetical protein HF982_10715 [Desulfobacteraceae bacterium]|nr:hypothetical protein [Desulfobacteraceae bacterium]MBC2720037.1 hypothetical protein [Desulfobacteraceae bacterium]
MLQSYHAASTEDKNRERVKKLYAILKKEGCDLRELVVDGELVGGTYLHKDEEYNRLAKKEQRELSGS